ncbi:hypothetical protein MG293_011200 [Ovis ammon polii]|uniref:Uncharacterized protein n=1 Tax=Ovis ammon polii TaxID=230172 RepID=A0AAD4Y8Y7_OVIAM|nr:hypothetical protein MG293_011200 [Ovis ammon polii]
MDQLGIVSTEPRMEDPGAEFTLQIMAHAPLQLPFGGGWTKLTGGRPRQLISGRISINNQTSGLETFSNFLSVKYTSVYFMLLLHLTHSIYAKYNIEHTTLFSPEKNLIGRVEKTDTQKVQHFMQPAQHEEKTTKKAEFQVGAFVIYKTIG